MAKLVITADAEMYGIMEDAAKFHGLPISLWARMVLLKEGRTVKHRILCQPKAPALEADKLSPGEIEYNNRKKEVSKMEKF